jgi:hypothetical protein
MGIVTEKKPRDVTETEARLVLGGRVFADVVVGHGALGGDHAEAVRVVGWLGGGGRNGQDAYDQRKDQDDGLSAHG